MPYGMESVADIPQITNALLAKGYAPVDVQKILGGNTLRLITAVENAAKKLGGKP
jgi:membrane dipeptidase